MIKSNPLFTLTALDCEGQHCARIINGELSKTCSERNFCFVLSNFNQHQISSDEKRLSFDLKTLVCLSVWVMSVLMMENLFGCQESSQQNCYCSDACLLTADFTFYKRQH